MQNNQQLVQTDTVKYLGLTLDIRLTWNSHTRLKRKTLNQHFKLLSHLLNRYSKLSLTYKLNTYTDLLKQIWAYGAQIFGHANNILTLQRFQSKFLRVIIAAPPFVINRTLHKDLNIPYVQTYIKALYKRFYYKLHEHKNLLIQGLT